MTKFMKTIHCQYYEEMFLKIGGNSFKRCITCANYELLFSKNAVFEIFVNKIIRKLLRIMNYDSGS